VGSGPALRPGTSRDTDEPSDRGIEDGERMCLVRDDDLTRRVRKLTAELAPPAS
jgi:hypothetical protein